NALIGSNEDHLKNFAMLHDRSGFFLSPAYDLLMVFLNKKSISFPRVSKNDFLNQLLRTKQTDKEITMYALAINGSPRQGGNTEQLLKTVLGELTAAGWETELVCPGQAKTQLGR
ncbi:MAG: HipA domain-containing protein, partial [Desulfatirhabdiaceae bacterium]|nr:HipA domain-containing protein [Desulfatirhabdiaceae bacterium]